MTESLIRSETMDSYLLNVSVAESLLNETFKEESIFKALNLINEILYSEIEHKKNLLNTILTKLIDIYLKTNNRIRFIINNIISVHVDKYKTIFMNKDNCDKINNILLCADSNARSLALQLISYLPNIQEGRLDILHNVYNFLIQEKYFEQEKIIALEVLESLFSYSEKAISLFADSLEIILKCAYEHKTSKQYKIKVIQLGTKLNDEKSIQKIYNFYFKCSYINLESCSFIIGLINSILENSQRTAGKAYLQNILTDITDENLLLKVIVMLYEKGGFFETKSEFLLAPGNRELFNQILQKSKSSAYRNSVLFSVLSCDQFTAKLGEYDSLLRIIYYSICINYNTHAKNLLIRSTSKYNADAIFNLSNIKLKILTINLLLTTCNEEELLQAYLDFVNKSLLKTEHNIDINIDRLFYFLDRLMQSIQNKSVIPFIFENLTKGIFTKQITNKTFKFILKLTKKHFNKEEFCILLPNLCSKINNTAENTIRAFKEYILLDDYHLAKKYLEKSEISTQLKEYFTNSFNIIYALNNNKDLFESDLTSFLKLRSSRSDTKFNNNMLSGFYDIFSTLFKLRKDLEQNNHIHSALENLFESCTVIYFLHENKIEDLLDLRILLRSIRNKAFNKNRQISHSIGEMINHFSKLLLKSDLLTDIQITDKVVKLNNKSSANTAIFKSVLILNNLNLDVVDLIIINVFIDSRHKKEIKIRKDEFKPIKRVELDLILNNNEIKAESVASYKFALIYKEFFKFNFFEDQHKIYNGYN